MFKDLLNLLKDFFKEGIDQKAVEKVLSEHSLPLKGINKEMVKTVMETNSEFKSYRDAFAKKAIDTFKEKTMPGLLEEELKKASPKEKTDLEKRLEALEKQNAEKDVLLKKQGSKEKLSKLLGEKKITNDKLNSLLEHLVADDDEQTVARGNSLIEGIQELLIAEKEKVLKETGFKPGNGGNPDFNKDDAKKFDEAEKSKDFATMLALANKKPSA